MTNPMFYSFKVENSNEEFKIPALFKEIVNISSAISSRYLSEKGYTIPFPVDSSVMIKFVEYLKGTNQSPSIQIYELSQFIRLAQHFELESLQKYIEDSKDIWNSYQQVLSLLLDPFSSVTEQVVEEVAQRLDEYILYCSNALFKIPIQRLYTIFWHPKRVLHNEDLAYKMITSHFEKTKKEEILILIPSLNFHNLLEDTIKDSILNQEHHMGMVPQINFKFFSNFYAKQDEQQKKIDELAQKINELLTLVESQSMKIERNQYATQSINNYERRIEESEAKFADFQTAFCQFKAQQVQNKVLIDQYISQHKKDAEQITTDITQQKSETEQLLKSIQTISQSVNNDIHKLQNQLTEQVGKCLNTVDEKSRQIEKNQNSTEIEKRLKQIELEQQNILGKLSELEKQQNQNDTMQQQSILAKLNKLEQRQNQIDTMQPQEISATANKCEQQQNQNDAQQQQTNNQLNKVEPPQNLQTAKPQQSATTSAGPTIRSTFLCQSHKRIDAKQSQNIPFSPSNDVVFNNANTLQPPESSRKPPIALAESPAPKNLFQVRASQKFTIFPIKIETRSARSASTSSKSTTPFEAQDGILKLCSGKKKPNTKEDLIEIKDSNGKLAKGPLRNKVFHQPNFNTSIHIEVTGKDPFIEINFAPNLAIIERVKLLFDLNKQPNLPKFCAVQGVQAITSELHTLCTINLDEQKTDYNNGDSPFKYDIQARYKHNKYETIILRFDKENSRQLLESRGENLLAIANFELYGFFHVDSSCKILFQQV